MTTEPTLRERVEKADSLMMCLVSIVSLTGVVALIFLALTFAMRL